MCKSRATVSAVCCLVVPAFICIDLLISRFLKINDDDDDEFINTDSVQLFLQFMHNTSIARNTIDSLTIQATIFNVANAHFHEKGNVLHQNKHKKNSYIVLCYWLAASWLVW